MEISKLIEELEKIKHKEGDLEVMITHYDGVEEFETTVENLFIIEHEFINFLTGSKFPEKVVKLTL